MFTEVVKKDNLLSSWLGTPTSWFGHNAFFRDCNYRTYSYSQIESAPRTARKKTPLHQASSAEPINLTEIKDKTLLLPPGWTHTAPASDKITVTNNNNKNFEIYLKTNTFSARGGDPKTLEAMLNTFKKVHGEDKIPTMASNNPEKFLRAFLKVYPDKRPRIHLKNKEQEKAWQAAFNNVFNTKVFNTVVSPPYSLKDCIEPTDNKHVSTPSPRKQPS